MALSKAIQARVDPETYRAIEVEAGRRDVAISTVLRERLTKAESRRLSPLDEIGTTGLRVQSGYVYEEFHRQLQGDRALHIYREMLTDSVVGGVMFAIDMLMRQVDWTVSAGGDSSEDERARELVETSLDDMSQSWADTLTEVLSMLAFGWSYHEVVYKRRNGPQRDEPGRGSRYGDGLIGWRKWAIRAQETRDHWEFGDDGGIEGMWQQDVNATRGTVLIPIKKALLFRPGTHKNNPEGRSCLRPAYRPWYYKKRIEEIEAIGIERDLAGLPVAKIPGQHIADNTQTYTDWKQMMRNVRRNEQECIVLPSDVDPETKAPLFEVELLTTGGRRQFDITPIVDRKNKEIALSMLADFIFLGQQSVGSFALASSKTSIFAMALGAWLDGIASTVNRHAIPRLLTLNGMMVDTPPYLQHGDIETDDPVQIADAVGKLAASGMPLWGGPDGMDLENWARTLVGAPEIGEDQYDQRLEEEAAEAAEELRQERERLDAELAAKEMRRPRKPEPPVEKAERTIEVPVEVNVTVPPSRNHFRVKRDAQGRIEEVLGDGD